MPYYRIVGLNFLGVPSSWTEEDEGREKVPARMGRLEQGGALIFGAAEWDKISIVEDKEDLRSAMTFILRDALSIVRNFDKYMRWRDGDLEWPPKAEAKPKKELLFEVDYKTLSKDGKLLTTTLPSAEKAWDAVKAMCGDPNKGTTS